MTLPWDSLLRTVFFSFRNLLLLRTVVTITIAFPIIFGVHYLSSHICLRRLIELPYLTLLTDIHDIKIKFIILSSLSSFINFFRRYFRNYPSIRIINTVSSYIRIVLLTYHSTLGVYHIYFYTFSYIRSYTFTCHFSFRRPFYTLD